MASVKIPARLWRQVIATANSICQYCLLHQDHSDLLHQIDHIIPRKYNGLTILINLALACLKCNKNKGPEIAGLDPVDNQIAPLFNPRTQSWEEHFELLGAFILGRTSIGWAAVAALKLNDPARVNQRQELMAEGQYPR